MERTLMMQLAMQADETSEKGEEVLVDLELDIAAL
jgi:hypothetical protein